MIDVGIISSEMMLLNLLAFLIFQTAGTPPKTGEKDPAWESYISLAQKLDDIERRKLEQRTGAKPRRDRIVLTQEEINSYLRLSPEMRLPPGVSHIHLRFESGCVIVRANLDLAQVKSYVPSTGTSIEKIVSFGSQLPVEISGSLDSKDGFGTFDLKEVWLGPALIPAEVVGRYIQKWTRSSERPQGVDILSPFRLPYSIQRVRLKSKRAVLEF